MRILFLDDEPRVLEALQRLLRPLRQEWDIATVTNAEEAFSLLAGGPFDAIVTDMRMPGMDGVDVLTRVTDEYPEMLRIVLSGQSDVESLVKSAGVAHQYLSKPCSLEDLKLALARGFALRQMLSDPVLRGVVSGTDAIPSMPKLYLELTSALESPDVSIAGIGHIVSQDIGMSSKVLQLVNSAFFGRSRRVSDPREAVCYLGTNTLRALLLAVHVFKCFGANKIRGFSLDKLWDHSMECSALAEKIARSMGPADKELADYASMAGLLHDAGRLLLVSKLPEKYAVILALAEAEQIDLWHAEREVLGVSHAEVGAYLLALWGLPTPIVEAVAYHHAPSACPAEQFIGLTAVHIASCLVSEQGPPIPNGNRLDREYLERLGIEYRVPAWRREWQTSKEDRP